MSRAALLLALLVGCAPAPTARPQLSAAPPPTKPTPALDIVAVRALLQPCPIELAKKYTATEATRVANARRDALIQCNKDKAAALEKINGG